MRDDNTQKVTSVARFQRIIIPKMNSNTCGSLGIRETTSLILIIFPESELKERGGELKMDKYLKSSEAFRKHEKLKSRWSDESKLSQLILVSLLNEIEEIKERIVKPTKEIIIKPMKETIVEISPDPHKYLLREYVNSFIDKFVEKWEKKHLQNEYISIPVDLFDDLSELKT